MELYANLGGKSGVRAYTIGEDYIDVLFSSGPVYRYSYRSAGSYKVEKMKRLALEGRGLNSFIKRYANSDYER